MKFAIVGNPENRRVVEFQRVCKELFQLPSKVFSWREILLTPEAKLQELSDFDIVRIDSPGENELVSHRLATIGSDLSGSDPIPLQRGQIGNLASTYLGFSKILDRLSTLNVNFFNHPEDIKVMFDKWASHLTFQRSERGSILRPKTVLAEKSVEGMFDQLKEISGSNGRFFLKPRYSSSASGVCAIHICGQKIRMFAPIEIDRQTRDFRLYNSLRVRTYLDFQDIHSILTNLLAEGMILESWIPKAKIDGKGFDFRVLVIDQKARHIVARSSHSPMTNLHLGNSRLCMERVSEAIGTDKLEEVKIAAEVAASCFPDSHYAGVDVILSSSGQVFIGEINAFGDLLPDLLHQGETTYQAILSSFLRNWPAITLT